MIANLKKEVKHVLQNWPETRNSDIALTIKVWQLFYGVHEAVDLSKLYELPREDNVKRIRAKFCEQGFQWAYPTEWKIARARKIKEDEWRMKLGYAALPDSQRYVFFENFNKVIQVPEDKVEDFLQLNPNALKL
jgi:hypothetical protein